MDQPPAPRAPADPLAQGALRLILGLLLAAGTVGFVRDGLQQVRFLADDGPPAALDLRREPRGREVRGRVRVTGFPGAQVERETGPTNEHDLTTVTSFYLSLHADPGAGDPAPLVVELPDSRVGRLGLYPTRVTGTPDPAAPVRGAPWSGSGVVGYHVGPIPDEVVAALATSGVRVAEDARLVSQWAATPSWGGLLAWLIPAALGLLAGLTLIVLAWRRLRGHVL